MATPGTDVLKLVKEREEQAQKGVGADVLAKVKRQQRSITDEQYASQYVNQESIDGDPADPGVRAFVSLFGDTTDERIAAFQKVVPDGEIIAVPSTDILLFRESRDEPFRYFDQPAMKGIIGGGKPEQVKEFISDLADAAGAVPEIVGEAASLMFGRVRGGGSLLDDLFRAGLGAFVGEESQQAAQTAAGTQREDLGGAVARGRDEAILSIVGGTLGAAVGGTVNAARGAGSVGVTPGVGEAQRAAERLGVPPLSPVQTTDVPFIQRIGRQAQAVLPQLRRYVDEQNKRTVEALRSLVDNDRHGSVADTILKAHKRAATDIQDFVFDIAKADKLTDQEVTRLVSQSVDQWWKASGSDVNALYNVARSIQEPQFDLAGLLDVATRIERGTPTPGKPVTKTVPTGVVGPNGKALTTTVTNVPEVQLAPLTPDLKKVIDDIKALDPSLPPITDAKGNPISGTDRLRALRKRLDDLSLPGPEGTREQNAIASQLRRAVVDTIEKPQNKNQQFVGAWRKANRAASERFSTREQLAVIDAVMGADPTKRAAPTQFAERLMGPNSFDTARALQRAMPPDRFERLQRAYKARLLKDFDALGGNLKQLDEATFRTMVPDAKERAAIRIASQKWQQLTDLKVEKLNEVKNRLQLFQAELFDSRDIPRIEALGRLIAKNGGRNSPLGKSVQSALIDEIWQRSYKVTPEGYRRVSGEALNNTLNEFERIGVMEFLTKEQRAVLHDVRTMQRVADVTAVDVGDNLIGATTAQGVLDLSSDAMLKIVRLFGVGRAMTSPWGIRLMVGTGKAEAKDTAAYKALGAAATILAADANVELGADYQRIEQATP